MNHDPAMCDLVSCELCDVYGLGYSRGKTAALQNLRDHVEDNGHDSICMAVSCAL